MQIRVKLTNHSNMGDRKTPITRKVKVKYHEIFWRHMNHSLVKIWLKKSIFAKLRLRTHCAACRFDSNYQKICKKKLLKKVSFFKKVWLTSKIFVRKREPLDKISLNFDKKGNWQYQILGLVGFGVIFTLGRLCANKDS